MFFRIGQIDIFQMFWRQGTKFFEKILLIGTKFSLTTSIDNVYIFLDFFLVMVFRIIFFFNALEAIEDDLFQCTTKFRSQYPTKILRVHVEICLFQYINFGIGPSNNDGVQHKLIRAQPLAGMVNHFSFSFVRFTGKIVQGLSQVTSNFTLDKFRQVLVINFFVTHGNLGALFTILRCKCFNQALFIGAPTFACFVNSIACFIYFVSKGIRRKIILVNNIRIKIHISCDCYVCVCVSRFVSCVLCLEA
mmetsp:Transcript_7579/g.11469  ORF Transcript_7579/g.11469 Transcript_7579/m.11469 type:complete len:248 (-) Transcript_7579:33-776(-)